MEFNTLWIANSVWGLASALGVATLGALASMGGRSRPRGSLAFGLFTLLWGIQIAVSNVATLLATSPYAATMHLIVLVLLLPLPYLLLEFAAAQLAPRHARVVRTLAALAAAIAFVDAVFLVLDPSVIFSVVRLGNATYPAYSLPHAFLVTMPFFAAFGIALVSLTVALRRSPTPRTFTRASALFAGLGLYVGFAAGNNLGFYVHSWFVDADAAAALFSALFFPLVLLVAWIAMRLLRDARLVPNAQEAKARRWMAASLLVPLAWGLVEAWLSVTTLPYLQTVGLWRLAGVAVIAYGLARWRFYDLPQRTTRLAATASGATAATASAAAAAGATTLATSEAAVPIVAALLVLSVTILPSVRFARRLFGVSEVRTQKADDQLYGQRIDAYRAALEASLARDSLDEDREFLAALRERFGITDAEERVLLHYARSSVIVARSDKAFDAFERLRLLGEGGGGRTWLARDRARDRLVVLKEPLDKHHADPAVRENVLREARLAARVRHPNVVNVEQVVESKGAPVIVMEYLEGGSLADVLRARGTLPWREAVEMTLGVLRGVEAVHAAGIIHRDVKPSNVLIGAEGAPKVADFGVAVPASSGATIVEGSSTFAGTLSYVAPEVRFRGQPADRRSDVYSCAVLLHECLHGAPPGRTAVVVQNDVPHGVTAALARGLADDPEARFATARAFAEELARLLR